VTATRVYLARLAGIEVFDPNGEQVGKVRDAVTLMRLDNAPPRVQGLVVEFHRRKIFVPMTRVNTVESAAVVLNTGTVSLKAFEKRPGETLVLGDLLDREVAIVETGRKGAVVDVAMERSRTKDWLLTKVAIAEPGKGMRRRGQIHQFDWRQVSGLALPAGEQGAANLLAAFERMRPADLASVLRDLSEKRRIEVAAALDDERLADVLEQLPEDEQVQILTLLNSDRAADVLEAMDPDDAADLLAELPAGEQERLLQLMEPAEAAPVRRLMPYSDDTAGGLMTSEPVVLPPDATVAEALAMIRNPQLSPALAAQVYVCRPPVATPTGRYLGIAHFQRLLREPPSELLGGVLDDSIEPIGPNTPLPEVTSHLATYDLVAIPVVDGGDRLVGAVTVDDVLDHLLPENWRRAEGVANG
jgi:CBS domain-containing protein